MKKIVLGLGLALLLSSNTYAFNFQPLYNLNKDLSNLLYIYQRCSAVMGFVASRSTDKNIVNTQTKTATVFLNLAVEEHQKINRYSFSKSLNSNENKVKKLISMYKEDSEKIYLQTGEYFGGVIKSDLSVCTGIIKGLMNRNWFFNI